MFQDSYATKDWRTLQFAPFWVSVVVAGADQEVEAAEAAVVAEKVAAVAVGQRRYDDPLVQEVFESIGKDLPKVMQEFHDDSRGVLDGLGDVGKVLESGGAPEQATHFKAEMLAIGIATAEASVTKHKGLLGRFRKGELVNDEEKVALVAITAALEGQLDTLRAAMG